MIVQIEHYVEGSSRLCGNQALVDFMIVSLSEFAVVVSCFKFIQSTLSNSSFLLIQTAYKFFFDEFIYFIMNFTLFAQRISIL